MRIHLPHLDWAQSTYGSVRHNLADSAVCAPTPDELGLGPVPLLSLAPRREREALEAALGERLEAPGGRVMLSAAGSEANACVFAGLLEPADEILLERPGYEPHTGVPAVFGLRTHFFERSAAHDYAVLAETIERRLTPRTRLVVFTDLHNPTSVAWGAGEAGALTALAERHGFHMLCDEAFRDADPDRPRATAARLGPRWIATASLTKSYGLGGLRLGWVAAHPDVLERCVAARRAFSVEPAHASVSAALALLPRLDALRARAHQILKRNAQAWAAFTTRLGALVSDAEPEGTVTWCRAGDGTAGDRLADYALTQHGVAVTPGRFFGDPRYVRVGLGATPAEFDRAIEALGAAYQEWAGVVQERADGA